MCLHYRPVSVCPSVTNRCSVETVIEMAERIEPIFGKEAILGLSALRHQEFGYKLTPVCTIFNKIMLLRPGYSTSFVLLSWYAQWLTSRIRKSDVTDESWDLSVSILQASAIGRARHVTRVRLNDGTASDETHFISIIRRLTRPPACGQTIWHSTDVSYFRHEAAQTTMMAATCCVERSKLRISAVTRGWGVFRMFEHHRNVRQKFDKHH